MPRRAVQGDMEQWKTSSHTSSQDTDGDKLSLRHLGFRFVFPCIAQEEDDYSSGLMQPKRGPGFTAPTAVLNEIAESGEHVSCDAVWLDKTQALWIS